MTKVNLTRRLHEPLRFGHPATLCAKDQHTGSVELQDVELARRLYKQEMCWASEQVELWISECAQDENVNPDPAGQPIASHKRLRVSQLQQRYTAERRVPERISNMTGARARGRGRTRGRQQSASGPGRKAHTMLSTSTKPGNH